MHTTLDTKTVDTFLMDHWDPIGIKDDLPATADEYTRYAVVVRELVIEAVTREEAVASIAAYLTWVRCKLMGFGDHAPRGGIEGDVAVAQRLLTMSDLRTNPMAW